ncbi:alpha/beta fold hydrolase [Nocardia vulneris]|uniref:alpha/beta fold hydrolase n=1 Tax=Nocardia vulneris TaxID=1141657 RepID=UPI0030CC2DBB
MTIPVPPRAGSGEPVLLLHPFGLSQHIWADVVEQLAGSHEVIAPTLPGHWGAARLSSATIGGYADAVERVMDEAGWPTAHIVGNSLGGWIGFELARRGRARSVVAIAPAGGWRHISTASVTVGLRFLSWFPFAVAGNLIGERMLRIRIGQKQVLRRIVTAADRVGEETVLDTLRALTHCRAYLPTIWMAVRHGGVHHLESLRVPILLALCENDRLLPHSRYAPFYFEHLPTNTEHVVLPGVGHVPALEQPELVASLITSFVAKQRAAVFERTAVRIPGNRESRWSRASGRAG